MFYKNFLSIKYLKELTKKIFLVKETHKNKLGTEFMKTAWEISSEILTYLRRIIRLLIHFIGTPVFYQGVTGGYSKKLGDNYEKSLYKKDIGWLGSFQFIKRKWLLFFINGPGPVRSKQVFESG